MCQTIKIGGENGDRGSFIGSLLAAQAGTLAGVVPASWQHNVTLIAEIVALAEHLADGGHVGTVYKPPTTRSTAPHLAAGASVRVQRSPLRVASRYARERPFPLGYTALMT